MADMGERRNSAIAPNYIKCKRPNKNRILINVAEFTEIFKMSTDMIFGHFRLRSDYFRFGIIIKLSGFKSYFLGKYIFKLKTCSHSNYREKNDLSNEYTYNTLSRDLFKGRLPTAVQFVQCNAQLKFSRIFQPYFVTIMQLFFICQHKYESIVGNILQCLYNVHFRRS